MNKSDRAAVARQIELVIRRLPSLSILPEVAVSFLPHLVGGRVNTAMLGGIIEADTALTAQILSLAARQGVRFTDDRPSVAEAVAMLPASVVRDAVLSVKVFQIFDAEQDSDSKRVLQRRQMAMYSLTVACCAHAVSKLVSSEGGGQLAFSAGLLHDIGKLAIDEVMPKSFEKVLSWAKEQKASLVSVERGYLGTNHVIIGKRLAEKWSLPEAIVLAIWLQNSDTEAIGREMDGVDIARIVRLAVAIARQSGIGDSGDYDAPPAITEAAESLGLSAEQIDTIIKELPGAVAEKSQLLGLDVKDAPTVYADLIAGVAAELSRGNTTLAVDNSRFAADSAQLVFIRGFLGDVTAEMSAIDAAVEFVKGFQKHYQATEVGIYLQAQADDTLLDMVWVDRAGEVGVSVLSVPAGSCAVAESLQRKFTIAAAADCAPWLVGQTDIDLDSARIAPLLLAGRALGAVVFTEHIPVDIDKQLPLLEVSTSIAARVIGMKFAAQKQAGLAERFAELLGGVRRGQDELPGGVRRGQDEPTTAEAFKDIAEMAAGAGHELNNPLAVISGRAQLLLDVETDESKKQMLKQIQQRSEDIAGIVTDLMAFATPAEPTPEAVKPRVLIDRAIARTIEKHGVGPIEMTMTGVEELGGVYVDAGQIVTAIGNVMSNALQSYKGDNGPMTVKAAAVQPDGFVTFTIADTGCGMDAETVARAFQPFFSARVAGRKRGMGLAHAQRLIQLNGGTIELASQPDKGSTVTIKLPRTSEMTNDQ